MSSSNSSSSDEMNLIYKNYENPRDEQKDKERKQAVLPANYRIQLSDIPEEQSSMCSNDTPKISFSLNTPGKRQTQTPKFDAGTGERKPSHRGLKPSTFQMVLKTAGLQATLSISGEGSNSESSGSPIR